MAKITLSKIARLDLKDILDFIKKGSIRDAYLEKIKIEGAVNRLIKNPLIGRLSLN